LGNPTSLVEGEGMKKFRENEKNGKGQIIRYVK
jgi:hypothetical protein